MKILYHALQGTDKMMIPLNTPSGQLCLSPTSGPGLDGFFQFLKATYKLLLVPSTIPRVHSKTKSLFFKYWLRQLLGDSKADTVNFPPSAAPLRTLT